MNIYLPAPTNTVDQRKLSLRMGIENDLVREFDESFFITAKVSKNILEVQNSCTVTIANLNVITRSALLQHFTAWDARNKKQPFVPLDIRIGRASNPDKLVTIFRGAISESDMSMPPDMIITLKCMTSLIDMNIATTDFLTKTIPRLSSHRELCQWAADLVNMPLRYEVEIPLPVIPARITAGVIQKAYSLTAVVGMLANFHKDKVAVFVDDGELIVTEWGKALRGELVEVNATTGLIGMPKITTWGVSFQTLADMPIRLAGAVNLTSELNPTVNQKWIVTGVEYDVTSRDNNWYATWSASPSA